MVQVKGAFVGEGGRRLEPRQTVDYSTSSASTAGHLHPALHNTKIISSLVEFDDLANSPPASLFSALPFLSDGKEQPQPERQAAPDGRYPECGRVAFRAEDALIDLRQWDGEREERRRRTVMCMIRGIGNRPATSEECNSPTQNGRLRCLPLRCTCVSPAIRGVD